MRTLQAILLIFILSNNYAPPACRVHNSAGAFPSLVEYLFHSSKIIEKIMGKDLVSAAYGLAVYREF
jgi:hypothetical protein